jgi:hypothetical protein
MPSKSKRNRRAFSQRAVSQRDESPKTNSNNTVASSIESSDRMAPVQSVKTPYSQTSKGAAAGSAIYTNFSRDLKWIGLVTGIVVILLIASYYLFK